MNGKIFVGCKLPHGLDIDHPTVQGMSVKLNGRNKIQIIGQTYGVTEVDAELWAAWTMFNPTYPALVSGMLFAADDEASLRAMGDERAKVLSGFERTDPEAMGVEPVDKKQTIPAANLPVLATME